MLRVRSVLTGVVGAPWYQNHYFLGVDSSTAAQHDIDAVAAYWAALDGLMDNAISIAVEAEVPQIDIVTGDMIAMFTGTAAAQVGDSAGNPLPYQTQGLIQWNTDTFVNGHRLIGRSFLPGFTVDNLDTNGTPTAGSITGMQGAVTAILAGTQPLAVWSRTHGIADLVEDGTVRDKFYVLRSRRD